MNTENILIVGDLHGRYQLVERVLNEYESGQIIFIGDYLDSFNRAVQDQIKCLELVLNACNSRRYTVTALLGNHELSYMIPDMRCSGYNSITQSIISTDFINDMVQYLVPIKVLTLGSEKILVSHAGADRRLWPTLKDLELAVDSDEQSLYNIGYARGGSSLVGGIFWADFWQELAGIDGLIQVVGHSAHRPKGLTSIAIAVQRHEKINSTVFNVDCQDRYPDCVLEIVHDKETKTIYFNEMDTSAWKTNLTLEVINYD